LHIECRTYERVVFDGRSKGWEEGEIAHKVRLCYNLMDYRHMRKEIK